MDFLYLLLIISFHSSIATSCTITVGLHEAFFTSEPRDARIKEGDSAVFRCSVSGFNNTSDFLTWAVKPRLYINIISQSFDEMTHAMTSMVTIFNAGKKEQTHQCILQRFDTDFSLHTCLSRVARLDVLHFPRQDDISCGPKLPGLIPEHDLVYFWCHVKQGNPGVEVSWQIDDLIAFARPVKSVDGLLVFQHYLRLSHSMHNKTLRCVVGSPAFPDVDLSCSIGPLNILQEPRLSITPTNVSLQSETWNARVKLFCKGDGIDFDNLLWSCKPTGAVLGCDGETTRQIEISLNTSAYLKDISYVTAICSAHSSGVRVEDRSNISLIHTTEKEISCTGVKMEAQDLRFLQNFSDVTTRTSFDTSFDPVISCFLQCEEVLANQVMFTWFKDDIILKEDLIKAQEVNGSFGSVLYLSHHSIQSKISSVKCEALVKDTNIFFTKNISLGYFSRANKSNSQNRLDEFETQSFKTTTIEQTTPLVMTKLENTASKAVQVSPAIRNNVNHESFPMSTFPSKIHTKYYPKTEKISGSNHVFDRKTLTLVSAVGASIFLLICLVALCNVAMYRQLRRASTTQHVVYNAEYKDNNDPLYEEPMGHGNRLTPPVILGVQQTIIQHESKVARNSASSESTSIISSVSSNNHSDSSQSLEYEDSNTSSDYSICFGPKIIEPNGYFDERPLSVESRFSCENDENRYENVYDNQTVVKMHRIGKPRSKLTERNPPSLPPNLVCDKHFQLPSFPPNTSTNSV